MKQFRVTSEKGYYFNCKVFDAKQEMYDYYLKRCKKWGEEHHPLDFEAMVSPYQRYNNEVIHKNIGEAIFYRQRLGVGLISHEMAHCAMQHERVVEGNKNTTFGEGCGELEERFCYTLTDYVIQFCQKCYKYNFFK